MKYFHYLYEARAGTLNQFQFKINAKKYILATFDSYKQNSSNWLFRPYKRTTIL